MLQNWSFHLSQREKLFIQKFIFLGGELVDAFHNGGQAEVEKLIKEQFSVFLYSEGKGQIINRSEYLRWKYRNQAQVKSRKFVRVLRFKIKSSAGLQLF